MMYDIPSTMKLVTIVFVMVLSLLKASQKEWFPIFVAFSGNGKYVYDAWFRGTETSPIQTDLTYDNRSHHLRSPIIDSWSEHNISKVKIELHCQDCMIAWMIFDGRGTTNGNWFHKDRLLLSSFDDKSEVKGFPIFKLMYYRVPFAILNWTCDEGYGVFVVLDASHYRCAWMQHDAYPVIMYTKNGTPRNWNTDAKKADYMVVYVRM